MALIITLIGGGVTYATVSSVQANINEIQEARTTYLEQDTQIYNIAENFTTTLQEFVKQKVILILNTSINIGEIEQNLTVDVGAEIFRINELLQDRQRENYRIEGLDYGFLGLASLGLDRFQSDDIINATEDGAYRTLNSFLLAKFYDFEFISNRIDVQLETLESNKTSLASSEIALEAAHDDYFDALSAFENSLLANGTAAALSILDFRADVAGNITGMMQSYQNTLWKLGDDPLAIDNATLNNVIDTSRAGVDTSLNAISTLGLNSADQALFDTLEGEITALFDQMEDNSDEINGIVALERELNTELDSIKDLETEALVVIENAVAQVTSESQAFQQRTTGYISQVRQQLNTNVLYVIGAVGLIIGALFFAIFMTLTLNIGRILDKNVRLARGDLTIRKRGSYSRNEIGIIEQNIDSFAEQISSIISTMQNSSEQLAGISEELAAGAEEASASISEVSGAVRQFSNGASEQNLMLNKVREELMDHIHAVEQTARSIDETANFVLKVASRTNILGLNASIQAAKAGKFGRGFNIVAQEVRSLSNETKGSAQDIAESIEMIEINIRQTVQDILDEVNVIREVAENTATGSSNASMATQEQVHMMNEVSQTSAQLSEISQELNEMMQNFKLRDEKGRK